MTYDYGRFTWFELLTADKDAAAQFYGEVMGWKVQTMDMEGGMKYSAFGPGESLVGGFADLPAPNVAAHWVSYLSVKDVDAAARAIQGQGGQPLMDAFDVPSVGRMQPVADAQGASLFLFHNAHGDDPSGSGPGHFHWNELVTPEPEAAVSFYEKALGYSHETMDMPNGTYFVLKNGDSPRGGVVKREADGPAHWQQFFQVDDCDAALKRAKKGGGQVVTPAYDVPGVGRVGIAADGEGARIGFIKPAAR